MLTVKPGQIWQRKSIEGAPWREMEVVNVGMIHEVELRFLDVPSAPFISSIQAATARRNRSCAPSARPAEKNVYSRQPARLLC